jgi:hypothetical protein
MTDFSKSYRALVSSDWNECLAPCGPFDAIAFNHPELEPKLTAVFRQYTGNEITLGEAARQIRGMLPKPFTQEQMDAYLDGTFKTYTHVPELMAWCRSRGILFMINTTGSIGYFQRVFAKGLLPRVSVLSAHPMIRFPETRSDPERMYDLYETPDKGVNTETAAKTFNIPSDRIILMGDSGGDGPHFAWGHRRGAFLIGIMTKPSLDGFCRDKGIPLHLKFGVRYDQGNGKDLSKEMKVDFMQLSLVFEKILAGK